MDFDDAIMKVVRRVEQEKDREIDELKERMRIALKEQDRDTRHACAEACLVGGENKNYIIRKFFHDICMNCRNGISIEI